MTEKNSTWKVETAGIDIIPRAERVGKPLELFWVWSAANIGILGVVYGAIIVAFGLSFVQSILAAIVGIASFALVGYISFSGKKGRAPTLTLSRAIFGIKGNIAPTGFSWLNLMGWEVVNIVTGTLTLAALLQTIGFSNNLTLTIISLVIFSGLTILVSLLGQASVVVMQSWFTRIFGTMTFIVVVYVLFNAQWPTILSMPQGSWLSGFLPAISIIAAGTGISWAIAGADYSRYQSENSSDKSIFQAVVLGASIPLFLLMLTGILLSSQLPDLAASENPIALIGSVLPPWMAIPYLMAATAGIVTIAVLSLYSASLNLLTIGIKVKQVYAVAIDAIIILALVIYILFIAGDFMGPFISFLIFCGVFLAAWEAIFILDYAFIRKQVGYDENLLFDLSGSNKGVKIIPLSCWLIGAISGLLVSNTGFIDGPFAIGIFADSSLGLFVSFFIAFILYGVYLLTADRRK